MAEVTATEAARRFADLLDAVEHRGERFTIVRRGRVVAQLQPIASGVGSTVKELLGRHRPDRAWTDDLASTRDLLELDERP